MNLSVLAKSLFLNKSPSLYTLPSGFKKIFAEDGNCFSRFFESWNTFPALGLIGWPFSAKFMAGPIKSANFKVP